MVYQKNMVRVSELITKAKAEFTASVSDDLYKQFKKKAKYLTLGKYGKYKAGTKVRKGNIVVFNKCHTLMGVVKSVKKTDERMDIVVDFICSAGDHYRCSQHKYLWLDCGANDKANFMEELTITYFKSFSPQYWE